jgi:hypothetical protein
VPAAAVIPALIAYINVVAVKKPVVGFEDLVREPAPICFGGEDHRVTVWQGSETCGIVHRQLARENSLRELAFKAESQVLHTP